MRVSQRFCVLALIIAVVVCPGTKAQQPSENKESAITSGTLNLVLANKNGFVIAADSRRSNPTTSFDCNGVQQHYCDDSQKLFRTSATSAIVIAGYAGGGARGTPLDLVMANVLWQSFGPCGQRVLEQSGDGKMRIRCAEDVGALTGVGPDSEWTKYGLEPPLSLVASAYKLAPKDMFFSVLFAGITQDQKVQLRVQQFSGTWIATGLQAAAIPYYQIQESAIITAEIFGRLTAGITCVADAILDGYYKSADPVIVRYYSKRNDRAALDSMSLAEMAELAHAILHETAKFTDYVGGADQIGVFPVNGERQWTMPVLPVEKSLAQRFIFHRCVSYTKGAPPVDGPCTRGSYFEDFQHPLDEVISQFFLGSQFTGVAVALDDNYFVRSLFDGVTFKYTGKSFLAVDNIYRNCKVEIPEGIALPADLEPFDRCEKIKKKNVTLDDDTVGKPIQWQHKGTRMVLPLPNR
jgi:hypothetical protein